MNPRLLALDPYDASLWVAGEKVLWHRDAQGQRLQGLTSADGIQALGLDVDESLWLLTHRQLLHLSPPGVVLQGLDLKSYIQEPESLAVDGLGGLLWVAGKKGLVQLDLHHLDQAPRTVPVPGQANGAENNTNDDDKKILALAVDPLLGNLWVVTPPNLLLLYDRGTNLLKTVDLGARDLGEVQTLAFEPVSASFWLGGQKAVARFTRHGDFVARIAADKRLETLGVSPFRLLPALSLLSPLDNSLTSNPRAPFRLGLGTSCNAIPCMLPDAYTQALSLDVLLNGLAIGNLFTLAQGEANYTPGQRLPEGLNLFTAQATDLFGHASEKITSRFTIDTIPPRFVNVSPAEGSVFGAPAVTIQGTVDDSTANTTLLDGAGNVLSMASGASFGFAVTLKPGLNVFSLTARDPAGNESTLALHLAYTPVSLTLVSPPANASLDHTSTVVSGTLQGPSNTGITVNGVVAMVYGDQFYANLDLDPGVNTLTITATTPDGATVTQTLTVTVNRTTPDPIAVSVEPQGGVAPLKVGVTVTSNTSRTIRRVGVDRNGTGTIDFTVDFTAANATAPITYTYANPGVYQPRLTITDSQGAVYSRSFTVVVDDAAQRARFYGTLWNGMNSALAAGNLAGANLYLNASAQRRYQPVFQALRPHLAEIISSYSPLQRVSISENIGEYAVNRTDRGQNRLYFIYFLRDADGVWRVDGM